MLVQLHQKFGNKQKIMGNRFIFTLVVGILCNSCIPGTFRTDTYKYHENSIYSIDLPICEGSANSGS